MNLSPGQILTSVIGLDYRVRDCADGIVCLVRLQGTTIVCYRAEDIKHKFNAIAVA